MDHVDIVSLPESSELEVATRLPSEPTLMEEGKIIVNEMFINGKLNPDIALIEASANTPIQLYEGDGKITDIFYSTTDDKAIGLILMSPEGEVYKRIYDPKMDGGPRGYSITKGWTMQTIVPAGVTLKFFDYWSPRGFMDPDGEKLYGENVVKVISDESVVTKFRDAEEEILDQLNIINR